MNRRIAALIVRTISIAMSLPLCPAMAETIEVAPGVQVSRRTFPAPVNETPFTALSTSRRRCARQTTCSSRSP
jgi:hypothetical protein